MERKMGTGQVIFVHSVLIKGQIIVLSVVTKGKGRVVQDSRVSDPH